MPPHYTRWHPRRIKYHHLAFPDHSRELVTSYSEAIKFLKLAFFNFDAEAFSKFCGLYEEKNGLGLRRQLVAQYPGWKQGKSRMSARTVKRVLECVPPCLSKEQQFSLIGFQIPSVLHQQKTALRMDSIYSSQLEDGYRRIARRIKGYDFTMEWFLRDSFSTAELDEFTEVFTFTMLDRLRLSFELVHQDLRLLFNALPAVDCGVDFRYRITLLDCIVRMDAPPGPLKNECIVLPPEPALITAHKPQYERILLEHELRQQREALEGLAHQRIALYDVESLSAQLERISTRQEYETTLQLQGSGGIVSLNLQKEDLWRLRLSMAVQVLKLALISGVFAISTLLMIRIPVLIPFIIAFGFIAACMISPVWEKLQRMKTEATEYEQKRSKWLATVRH